MDHTAACTVLLGINKAQVNRDAKGIFAIGCEHLQQVALDLGEPGTVKHVNGTASCAGRRENCGLLCIPWEPPHKESNGSRGHRIRRAVPIMLSHAL